MKEKIKGILLKYRKIEDYTKFSVLDLACKTIFTQERYKASKKENNISYYCVGQGDILEVLDYIHDTFIDECREKGEAGMIELKDLIYKCYRELSKNIDYYQDLFE